MLQMHKGRFRTAAVAGRRNLLAMPLLLGVTLTGCGNSEPAAVDSRTHGGHGEGDGGSEAAAEKPVSELPLAKSDAAASSKSEGGSEPSEDGLTDPSTPDAAVDTSLDLAQLRFSKIAAGREHWCGITKSKQDLICVHNSMEDTVSVELSGPIVDFDMSHDLAEFHYWCAVTGEGSVVCGNEQMEFAGTAEHVAVGFFNACASDDNHVECFFPESAGGFDNPPGGSGPISAEMSSLCFSTGDMHATCVDPQGDLLLPPEGHYLDVVAIPGGACAAIVPLPEGIRTLDAGVFTAVLANSGVACFQHGNVEVTPLSGRYFLIDADVNGDGCAFGGEPDDPPQVRCWGAHANTVPLGVEAPQQIAVSTTQVCILDEQEQVTCYKRQ